MDIYVGVTANGCSTTWGWVDNLAIVPAIAVVEAVDDTPALGLTTAPAAGSITLDPATGEVTVAPGTTADSYVYTYEICEVLNPSNCDTAQVTVQVDAVPIVAVDDDFSGSPINTFEGGTAGSVPSNDTINGTAVATDGSQTTITLVDDGGIEGATISADGTITIPAGIPQGSYTPSYQLCESLNPENCDTAIDLSQRRVEAVLAELSARGVKTVGYMARGMGESEPITSNAAEAGAQWASLSFEDEDFAQSAPFRAPRRIEHNRFPTAMRQRSVRPGFP